MCVTSLLVFPALSSSEDPRPRDSTTCSISFCIFLRMYVAPSINGALAYPALFRKRRQVSQRCLRCPSKPEFQCDTDARPPFPLALLAADPIQFTAAGSALGVFAAPEFPAPPMSRPVGRYDVRHPHQPSPQLEEKSVSQSPKRETSRTRRRG